jgi:hypothetical protein
VRDLIDPRLRTAIPEMWPSFCTIMSNIVVLDPANQPIPGVPTVVPGMKNIECRVSPLFLIRPDDKEIRGDAETTTILQREIKLNGYYPFIQPHTMQAVVGNESYHIVGVESDGNNFSTRMRVEIIRP